MSNKSKTLGLLSAFTAIATMSSELEYSKYGRPTKRDNNDDTVRKNESIFSEEEKKSKDGLKKFTYNGVDVYAINQKNADKKARKLGLI